MRRAVVGFLVLFLGAAAPHTARAEFIISTAILEFTKDSPTDLDVELISRSKDNDYIDTEISEIVNPGMPDEKRVVIDDPSQGMLLVTPDKTILAGGNRKLLRFVLLKDLDEREHIYRVTVKPVIRGIDKDKAKVGLKILVGYEVLVIARPADIHADYTAVREGKILKIANNGNSNILFQTGQQCKSVENCKNLPLARVYPGEKVEVPLSGEGMVHYSIWNGQETIQKQFE